MITKEYIMQVPLLRCLRVAVLFVEVCLVLLHLALLMDATYNAQYLRMLWVSSCTLLWIYLLTEDLRGVPKCDTPMKDLNELSKKQDQSKAPKYVTTQADHYV